MSEEVKKPLPWAEVSSKSPKALIPIYAVEWYIEWVSYFLSHWAIFDLLDRLGRLSVLIAAVTWLASLPFQRQEARKASVANAWSVLNSARGSSGNGGRNEAIRTLIAEGTSLSGLDLAEGYYEALEIRGQTIKKAQFHDAHFFEAHFADVELSESNLENTEFEDGWLENTRLLTCNLRNVIFSGDTTLDGADFNNSVCSGGEFHGSLVGTDLTAVDLRFASLKGIRDYRAIKSVKHANIFGLRDAPDGFREWATAHGAVEIKETADWIGHLKREKYNGVHWVERQFKQR